MDQINDVELRDESIYPDEAVLARVLGPAFTNYSRLLELLARRGLVAEWRYYRDGKAWLCKVQLKTRTIVWMSVGPLFLKATVYFPEKHSSGIFDLPLTEDTKSAIRDAKNIGKLRPCTFGIAAETDLSDIEAVIDYKIACR